MQNINMTELGARSAALAITTTGVNAMTKLALGGVAGWPLGLTAAMTVAGFALLTWLLLR